MSKDTHDAEEGPGYLGDVEHWVWALRPEFRASEKSAHTLLSLFLRLKLYP